MCRRRLDLPAAIPASRPPGRLSGFKTQGALHIYTTPVVSWAGTSLFLVLLVVLRTVSRDNSAPCLQTYVGRNCSIFRFVIGKSQARQSSRTLVLWPAGLVWMGQARLAGARGALAFDCAPFSPLARLRLLKGGLLLAAVPLPRILVLLQRLPVPFVFLVGLCFRLRQRASCCLPPRCGFEDRRLGLGCFNLDPGPVDRRKGAGGTAPTGPTGRRARETARPPP